MAISFPLSIEQFADRLAITEVKWRLQEQQEYSGLGSGEVLAADLGPSLWMGDVRLAVGYHDDVADIQAMVETLDGSINSFFLYDPRKTFPRDDPDGSKLGASVPRIYVIGANNKSLALKGLPNGYVLSRGDFLSFDYGTNPVRRAFHRIVETVTAGSNGNTIEFEVRPHLRPGVVMDLAVTLVKPAAKVIMVPNTFDPGAGRAVVTDGMSFQVVQTLR